MADSRGQSIEAWLKVLFVVAPPPFSASSGMLQPTGWCAANPSPATTHPRHEAAVTADNEMRHVQRVCCEPKWVMLGEGVRFARDVLWWRK